MNKHMSNTAIIGTVGVPASYGGFETLVENLIETEKVNYIVYCSSKNYPKKISTYKNAKLVYIPLSANGISSVIYDAFSILHAIVFRKVNTLLILGVSGCFILPIIKKISSVKIITNIDGVEWRRDKWGRFAKKFLKWSEKIAVKNSDIVISDNKEIANYVCSEYMVNSQVIAYGGDHSLVFETKRCNDVENSESKYALALCRIEPENNVHVILESFSKVTKKLKFIGNWGSSDYGRSLKKKYSKYNNIEIIDPIYDVEQLNIIRSGCEFYVHGHSAGGTNPSLVEMMFFAKPIICFDCKYNRYTTFEQACYFRDLKDLIIKIESPKERTQGVKLKSLAEKHYTWNRIREQYEQLL